MYSQNYLDFKTLENFFFTYDHLFCVLIMLRGIRYNLMCVSHRASGEWPPGLSHFEAHTTAGTGGRPCLPPSL